MECVLYDFDETLTLRDTTRLFVRAMWRVKPKQVFYSVPDMVKMRLARGSTNKVQSAKFSMFGKQLRGLDDATLNRVTDVYVDETIRIIRKDVWGKLEENVKRGIHVVIVTASPRFAVQAVFKDIPASVIGTEFSMQGGIYTGEIEEHGCFGDKKVIAIKKWISELSDDVRFVEAWSDSYSDAPMMQLAEKRFWICPPCNADLVRRKDPKGFIYVPQRYVA